MQRRTPTETAHRDSNTDTAPRRSDETLHTTPTEAAHRETSCDSVHSQGTRLNERRLIHIVVVGPARHAAVQLAVQPIAAAHRTVEITVNSYQSTPLTVEMGNFAIPGPSESTLILYTIAVSRISLGILLFIIRLVFISMVMYFLLFEYFPGFLHENPAGLLLP
jgi:hypothetical protein